MIPHPITCPPEALEAAEAYIARLPDAPYSACILLAAEDVRKARYLAAHPTPRRQGGALRAIRSAAFLESRHNGGHRRERRR